MRLLSSKINLNFGLTGFTQITILGFIENHSLPLPAPFTLMLVYPQVPSFSILWETYCARVGKYQKLSFFTCFYPILFLSLFIISYLFFSQTMWLQYYQEILSYF